MKIRVPATSANLGPGFDSCGIAVTKYLFVEVLEASEKWEIVHDLGESIPANENNLLIKAALKVYPHLPPQKIRMTSDIPLARGLGSSSSVIVAGIELANRLGNLNLTDHKKLMLAANMEGHPDNVAPAIFGDFVVASQCEEENKTEITYSKHYFPECEIIAFVPSDELLTTESRQVLPETLTYKEAVAASAISNVMIAALISGDLTLAGKMMQKDRWHENYRSALVPHLGTIQQICRSESAYGCFLSGAGPTVLILAETSKVEAISRALQNFYQDALIEHVQIDREGIQVF